MSKVFVEDTEMQDIANAIREKNGTDTKYLPSEMGGAVRAIVSNYQNIQLSEIVIDTATVNAKQVNDYLITLTERAKYVSIFVNKKIFKKDTSLFSIRELVIFQINPFTNSWCRMNGTFLEASINMGDGYDLILNIGDEYYLIEMPLEGDNA